MDLPIYKVKSEFCSAYKNPTIDIIFISGATGSGKSTQIPQYIHEALKNQIFHKENYYGHSVITQPRRVAAMGLYKRVTEEITSTKNIPKECKSSAQTKNLDNSADTSKPTNNSSETSTTNTNKLTVGYSVRFDTKFHHQDTKIKFSTDGMFVKELCVLATSKNEDDFYKNFCRKYLSICIDEIHEMSIHTEFLLSILKSLLIYSKQTSSSFKFPKIILMSATLNNERLENFLQYENGYFNIYKINVPGKSFPIETFYTKTPLPNIIESTATTILQILAFSKFSKNGDILVFLPGVEEIEQTERLIKHYIDQYLNLEDCGGPFDRACQMYFSTVEVEIIKIYGRMSIQKQQQVLNTSRSCKIGASGKNSSHWQTKGENSQSTKSKNNSQKTTSNTPTNRLNPANSNTISTTNPPTIRRVILSTNVAETSLTIDNIDFVIDSGLCKRKTLLRIPNSIEEKTILVEILSTTPISQSSADQRKGRCGRNRPGQCFRLYCENSFNFDMEKHTSPDLLSSKIEDVLLEFYQLKSTLLNSNISIKLKHFLSIPTEDQILNGNKELIRINALYEDGILSPIGKFLSTLPLEPKLGRFVFDSIRFGISEIGVAIASMIVIHETLFSGGSMNESSNAMNVKNKESTEKIPSGNFIKFSKETMTILETSNYTEIFKNPQIYKSDHFRLFEIFFKFFTNFKNRKEILMKHSGQINVNALYSAKKAYDQILNICYTTDGHYRESLRDAINSEKLPSVFDCEKDIIPSTIKVYPRFLWALLISHLSNISIPHKLTEDRSMISTNKHYVTVDGLLVCLHPGSVFKGDDVGACVFSSLLCTNNVYVKIVSHVGAEECQRLHLALPRYFKQQ